MIHSLSRRVAVQASALLLLAAVLRAAEPEPPKPLTREQAVAAAETLIAAQGHLEPVEPKAAGARLDSGVWFVGFRAVSPGGRIRGVSVTELGGSTRRLNQNLPAAWLTGTDAVEQAEGVTAEQAKAAALRLVKGSRPKAGETVAVDEAPAEPGRYPDGAWRVSFTSPKAKKGSPAPVVVLVDRKSGEARLASGAKKR